MASPRKPGFVLPVAVTLAVLLGLYVGAYYMTVEPLLLERTSLGTTNPVVAVANYRRFPALGTLFSPIHWLDRRIRPHVWEP